MVYATRIRNGILGNIFVFVVSFPIVVLLIALLFEKLLDRSPDKIDLASFKSNPTKELNENVKTGA
jgi:hypothetical protein